VLNFVFDKILVVTSRVNLYLICMQGSRQLLLAPITRLLSLPCLPSVVFRSTMEAWNGGKTLRSLQLVEHLICCCARPVVCLNHIFIKQKILGGSAPGCPPHGHAWACVVLATSLSHPAVHHRIATLNVRSVIFGAVRGNRVAAAVRSAYERRSWFSGRRRWNALNWFFCQYSHLLWALPASATFENLVLSRPIISQQSLFLRHSAAQHCNTRTRWSTTRIQDRRKPSSSTSKRNSRLKSKTWPGSWSIRGGIKGGRSRTRWTWRKSGAKPSLRASFPNKVATEVQKYFSFEFTALRSVQLSA